MCFGLCESAVEVTAINVVSFINVNTQQDLFLLE